MSQPISSWNLLQEQLRQDYTVKQVDLSTGRVPGDVDVLLRGRAAGHDRPGAVRHRPVPDARRRGDRGGGQLSACAPQQFPGGLTSKQSPRGLREMLAHYGVEVGQALVMDPQNEPFPVQVQRKVGGMQVIEIQELDYPFFVDVRSRRHGRGQPHRVQPAGGDAALGLAADGRRGEERRTARSRSCCNPATSRGCAPRPTSSPIPTSIPSYGFPVEGEQAPAAAGRCGPRLVRELLQGQAVAL